MNDKRIKLITKIIVITWGVICMGLIVIDSIWHNLGILPVYSFQPAYNSIEAIGKTLIFFSTILTFFVNIIFIGIVKFLGIKANNNFAILIEYTTLILLQTLIYYYLGNLVGELIIWIKHQGKKSTPQPKE